MNTEPERKIRCFISVNLPPEIKEKAGSVISSLIGSHADVKWVRPESLHITLKFIGYVREEEINTIYETALKAIKGSKPFMLEVSGIGSFPEGRKSPRVIWVGIKDLSGGDLLKVQQKTEGGLARIGIEPEERPFSPHVTIGRVSSQKNAPALMSMLATFKDTVFGKINVENIYLMRSELRPSGAQYSVIKEIPLSG